MLPLVHEIPLALGSGATLESEMHANDQHCQQNYCILALGQVNASVREHYFGHLECPTAVHDEQADMQQWLTMPNSKSLPGYCCSGHHD